jgi:hypothetical protein
MPSATTKSPPADTLPSADEREAAGKAAHAKASRSSHGEWEPAVRRKDPVKVLEDQAKRAPFGAACMTGRGPYEGQLKTPS